MTNPKNEQRKPDKLDLDVETLKDLEPDKESADAVRGGRQTPKMDFGDRVKTGG
jgi:hypothetical protein